MARRHRVVAPALRSMGPGTSRLEIGFPATPALHSPSSRPMLTAPWSVFRDGPRRCALGDVRRFEPRTGSWDPRPNVQSGHDHKTSVLTPASRDRRRPRVYMTRDTATDSLPLQRFRVLFKPLFRVLFKFPSRYTSSLSNYARV